MYSHDKPKIELPPEEGVDPPADVEEEDVPEEDFLGPKDAESDDTIDDSEQDLSGD